MTTGARPAGYHVSYDGNFGLIAKTDDIDDLADKFVKICTDEDFDWNKHAVGISEYAKSVFDWEKIVTYLYGKIKEELKK